MSCLMQVLHNDGYRTPRVYYLFSAGSDAFTLAAIFGWSDIRMAMGYTHAMEDAKRRADEAIAQIQSLRDRSVTDEKRARRHLAVS